MRGEDSSPPQGTRLYRAVAFLTRFQLGTLVRTFHAPQAAVLLFVFLSGATALGILTTAAVLTNLPLVFPPLGPSAFILFRTPLADAASPRSVILAHASALAAGLLALQAAARLFPHAVIGAGAPLGPAPVFAIAFAMGLVSVAMITVRCSHPPAAATALIAAMGYFENVVQVAGLLAAVFLLVGEALLFNRLLGGLPYPLWRAVPNRERTYGTLAGVPEDLSYWRKLESRIYRRRA